jgi:tetratricopeptide (TPR) repeat protein
MSRRKTWELSLAIAFELAWLMLLSGPTPLIAQSAAGTTRDLRNQGEGPAKPRLDEQTRQAFLESFREVVRRAMEEKDPGLRSWALLNIAHAQANLGDRGAARGTFEAAAKSALEIADPQRRATMLRLVAESQAGTGDRDGLTATLDLLREKTEEMDLSDKLRYRTEIARVLAEGGDRELAREKFQETLELFEGFGDNDVAFVNAVSSANLEMVSVGEFDLALKAAAAVPVEGLSIRSSMIHIIARGTSSAPPREAEKVLSRALKLTEPLPDDGTRLDVLEKLAVARARGGDLRGALACVDQLSVDARKVRVLGPSADVRRANVLGRIAEARAKAGDLKGATEAAGMIGKDARDPSALDPKPPAMSAIAQEQARQGDIAAARTTFDEAVRVAQGLESDDIKAERLGSIAAARAGIGDIEGAFKTIEAIIGDDQRKCLALVAVARVQLKAGRKPEAIATLERASQALGPAGKKANRNKSRGHWNRLDAIRMLAATFAQAGAIDKALNEVEAIDDKPSRKSVIATVAIAQAQSGDFDGALKTISRISDVSRSSAIFGEVAKAQAEAGHAADARAWIDKLDSPMARADAYRALAEVFAAPAVAGK